MYPSAVPSVAGSTGEGSPNGRVVLGAGSPTIAVGAATGTLAMRRRSTREQALKKVPSGKGTAGAAGSSNTIGAGEGLEAAGRGAAWQDMQQQGPRRQSRQQQQQEVSPELQEAVDKVTAHMNSKDWRERCDALRALVVLLPAVPCLPDDHLQGLVAAVVPRLMDGNAKVNELALEVRRLGRSRCGENGGQLRASSTGAGLH